MKGNKKDKKNHGEMTLLFFSTSQASYSLFLEPNVKLVTIILTIDAHNLTNEHLWYTYYMVGMALGPGALK